jgi:flagellar hook-associated protein 1 FlgK
MGLYASLVSSANTLRVYNQLFATAQNNINNSSTPDYATQTMTTVASPFQPSEGLTGGVTAGALQSSRDLFAEQDVRSQNQAWGSADQQTSDLQRIEPLFDVTDANGLSGVMNQFFSDASAWSLSPNDTVARQSVINDANNVAAQFNQAGNGLANEASTLAQETGSTLQTINSLAAQIGQLNTAIVQSGSNKTDPGIDAAMQSALENLSEYVNFTTMPQSNGTVTVLAGGQTPLVIGGNVYRLSSGNANQQTAIFDSYGQDVTGQIQSGRLGALLNTANVLLPSYTSQMDQLASGFAQAVNGVLANGVDANGKAGAALFSFNAAHPAQTIGVTAITPDQLAAASASAPGGNGNALALAALANNSSELNGMNFTGYYGQLASQAGEAIQNATNAQQTGSDLLAQARTLRNNISGVSLDAQATNLIELQQGYDANAKLVTVLDGLTQTTIDMLNT